jgi:hypothetical protein
VGSFAPKGHARVDPQRPSAFGICDECGFLYQRNELRWQTEFYGREVRKTGFLRCPRCFDSPNPTLRPVVLPADPVPILQPRAEPTFYSLVTADMIKYTADDTFVTDSNITADNG